MTTQSPAVACARAMALCAESGSEIEMVDSFSEAVATARPVEFQPNPLPVLENLRWVKDMRLARSFQAFAPFLPWKFSPRMRDRGTEAAICDFGSMFKLENILAGLMYVDTGKCYLEHNHLPRELYFLISGTGLWRYGGNPDYQPVSAGNILYNNPWNWHGVRAGDTPLLALYLQTP